MNGTPNGSQLEEDTDAQEESAKYRPLRLHELTDRQFFEVVELDLFIQGSP